MMRGVRRCSFKEWSEKNSVRWQQERCLWRQEGRLWRQEGHLWRQEGRLWRLEKSVLTRGTNAGASCLRDSQSPLTLEELALEGEWGEVMSEKEWVEREVGSRRLWDFAGWGRGFVPDAESNGSHKAFCGEESKIWLVFYLLFKNCICLWLCSVSAAAPRLSPVAASRGALGCARGLLVPVTPLGVERRLSSSQARARWCAGSVVQWTGLVVLVVKSSPASAGDRRDESWIPGWGRFPAEGNDSPPQYY